MNITPVQRDLVLVGGGHSHIQVLRSFGMRPIEGVRLTLITDVLKAPYSGMLPGFIERIWQEEDLMFDLTALSVFAGARLIHQPIAHIDIHNKNVIFKNSAPVSYDVISVNSGAVPDISGIHGAQEYGIPVKPISRFLEKLPEAHKIGASLAIIGGGAAGSELALAMRARMKKAGIHPEIHIISRSPQLLPQHSKAGARVLSRALLEADIALHCGAAATQIDSHSVTLESGKKIQADTCLIATAARPADWVSGLSIAKDSRGFIIVTPSFNLPDFSDFFAAGDIASVTGHEQEKAGVFAVRAGPVLDYNLRATLTGQRLKHWRPQKRYMALIGLANGKALFLRHPFISSGVTWLKLKHWIDQRFMEKFTKLPPMNVISPQLLPQINLSNNHTAPANSKDSSIIMDRPTLPDVYCAGCGSKAEAEQLRSALLDACETARSLGADPTYFPPEDIFSDAAEMPLPSSASAIIQSVDFLSQPISDPFLFGRIAALHAMSDIFVTGARPLSALALVMTHRSLPEVQRRDLSSLLAGALIELSAHYCNLSGGHTVSATDAGLGFSITGLMTTKQTLPSPDEDVTLILTKPLGIGIILAAHMRGLAPAESFEQACQVMAQSNASAASVISALPVAAMTDVTGFGLARHALNLAARCGFPGINLIVDDIPLLKGAVALSGAGVASSLMAGNRRSITQQQHTGGLSPEKQALLFDPQTSGGVLAAVPSSISETVTTDLSRFGIAVPIGSFTKTQGLILK